MILRSIISAAGVKLGELLKVTKKRKVWLVFSEGPLTVQGQALGKTRVRQGAVSFGAYSFGGQIMIWFIGHALSGVLFNS